MQKRLDNEILESGQTVTLNRSDLKINCGDMGYGRLMEYVGRHSGNIEVWSIWWSHTGRESVFGFRMPLPIEPLESKEGLRIFREMI